MTLGPGAPALSERSDEQQAHGWSLAGVGGHASRGRPRWWVELLVVAALIWFYDAITNLPAVREHEAVEHGLGVLRLERSLHLDPELALNHWIYGHPLVGVLAGDVYDNAHFIVTFGLAGWLWWRHPDLYRPLRTGLVLVNVIGFVVFWFWPMAPPRLLPGQHFYDIVAITHAIGGWHSGALAKVANQFAAMPSLHLGWATWSGFVAWWVWRRHRAAVLVWLYPPLICVDVIATANHLLTDCLAGTATAAVSLLIAFRAPGWIGRCSAAWIRWRCPSR